MKEFKAFYFESFRFDIESFKAVFLYSFDKAEYFEEEIDFSVDGFVVRDDIESEVLNNFLFQVHIALGISYYKLFPTNDLFVESGFLDDIQLNFWKKFYKNGLGEFLYKNDIKPGNLLNFHSGKGKKYERKDFKKSDKALVPLGGGKDSLVSIELLREAGVVFETAVFGKMDEVKTTVSKQVGVKNMLIKRVMSQNLFKLNDQQYYNGHVPITGIIAFVLYTGAYLYNYKYIVMSNELSANDGNFSWEGFEVNHQYSKSLEFEKDLQAYMNGYVTYQIAYFSLLRGMYEYKIAELFAGTCKKYFKTFASCNKNFFINSGKNHSGNWCLKCEKCVFVYLILAAHIDKKNMIKIFGSDLFLDKELEMTFRDILGIGTHKPFECVGTNEESVYSLYKYFQKNPQEGWLYKIYSEEIEGNLTSDVLNEMEIKLKKIHKDDIIPKELKEKIIKK